MKDTETTPQGKIIIISAPSGCGKSTIIHSILDKGNIDLMFSVSATNRPPRHGEVHGEHYYFLSTDEFKDKIAAGEFVEFEEVYPGRYYGTLRSELERICEQGHNVVLDIDVKGGVRVKKLFGDSALSIFIMPPSITELRHRLETRGTDSQESIDERVGKAQYELTYAPNYDITIVNDDLDVAISDTESAITKFIGK